MKRAIRLKSWPYRAFSHTCQHERGASPGNEVGPAQMFQMYWNKRYCLHKKRVQLLQDWFGTPPWLGNTDMAALGVMRKRSFVIYFDCF